MRHLPILAAAALLAATPAGAADLYNNSGSTKDPVIPASSVVWTGLYGGANIGYGWAGSRSDLGITHYNQDGTIDKSGGGTVSFPTVDGVIGGGQVGYDLQKGNFVGGVVASFEGSAIGGSRSKASPTTNDNGSITTETGSLSQNIDWYGTAGVRGGFAFSSFLVYGTGGFAFGNVSNKLNHSVATVDANGVAVTDPTASYSEGWKSEGVRTGYFVGGGVSYKAGNWDVFSEYNYVDLGSYSISGATVAGGSLGTSSIHSDVHVVKVGLNYHLNN